MGAESFQGDFMTRPVHVQMFLAATFILFALAFFHSSCTMQPTKPVVEAQQKPAILLAWGLSHPDWDKYLSDAVNSSSLKPDVKLPCKKLNAKDCLIQTISIMAKYESSFNPAEKYTESFADASGVKVVSRGLLQVSQESANQKAYDCKITDPKQLHDPKINLECAVKIAVKWINQDGVFFGGDKLGLGRYWSVGRKSSGSNAKILKYLEGL